MNIMQIYLDNSNIFANFEAWIGGSCKPSDKGKLTTFPRFIFCQQKLNNVSNMLRFEDLPEINSPRWLSLEDLEGEVWKDSVEFQDFLQVSCYGRVKRKERITHNPRTGDYVLKEMIFRENRLRKNYRYILFCVGGSVMKGQSVHRLVAMTFIPNPYNLPFVNHKDENPSNNCVDNLEWCTQKYNMNYGTCRERISKTKVEKGMTRKVVLYDYDGNVLKRYDSIANASIDSGVGESTIRNCCNGVSPTACGLHFRYENDKYIARDFAACIYRYDVYKNNNLIFSTDNTKGLCRALNVNYGCFRDFNKYDRYGIKGLEDYEIVVHTPKGEKYRIKNNKKVFEL